MKHLIPCLLFLLVLPACSVKLDLDADILEGEDTAVCWMETLADDTPLAALSIPGAHDAASSSITAWPSWTRTQDKNVAELWNCGVRAFDLRPALVDGELGIYHDKYSAHISLPQIMQALVLALEKHPGEFAIVIIRHEEEADGNDPQWKNAMGTYLSSIRPSLVDYSPALTLGDLRGKILVLSRNEYSGGPVGGYLRGWSHSDRLDSQKSAFITDADGNSSPLWVQDYYHPEGIEDKWAAVKGLLDATASAGDKGPLVINHTSGYLGSLPDYRANAKNINAQAAEYLSSRHVPAGIVLMDFAGESRSKGVSVGGDQLVRMLIDNNHN
jgi:hypothetical protein